MANQAPTAESVAAAFNATDSALTAGTYAGFMYTAVLGLFLLMSVFIVFASLRDGSSLEERQFNFIRTVGVFAITFILLLLFIGIVIVAT